MDRPAPPLGVDVDDMTGESLLLQLGLESVSEVQLCPNLRP